MNKSTITFGSLALVTNIILGILISKYALFNVCLNSAIIIVSTILILLVGCLNLKDALKVSLSLLFSVVGLIELICGFLSKDSILDNWVVISCVVLTLLETTLLIAAKYISNKQ